MKTKKFQLVKAIVSDLLGKSLKCLQLRLLVLDNFENGFCDLSFR